MAKVTGPLFSMEARGKIGDAIVYFPWKGMAIVRGWKEPAQPRPPAVMNLRLKMKALGKVSKVFSTTSTLRADMVAKAPNGSTWTADWIGVAIKQFVVDNDAWDALIDDIGGATAAADFASEAGTLGLLGQALTVEGKAADHPVLITGQAALYLLAKACWYREVLDAADTEYTDPKIWETAAVEAFAARIID